MKFSASIDWRAALTEAGQWLHRHLIDEHTRDVSAGLYWMLGAIVLVYLTILWLSKSRCEVRHITDEPESLFHYFRSTIQTHRYAYLAFFVIPLGVGVLFKINVLSIFAVWGFLVTSLSAFYATRADFASGKARTASDQALIASHKALEQAQQTYQQAERTFRAVVHFADSLEAFVERIQHELPADDLTPVTMKLLTVIPAFASVGLQEYYARLKTLNIDGKFHDFLLDTTRRRTGSKLLMLTHGGQQAADWILDITAASTPASEPAKTLEETILERTKSDYLAQKRYLWKLRGHGVDEVELKFWDSQKLKKLINAPVSPIPIQFLIVTRSSNTKVFVLFSGSYLYDFVFRAVGPLGDMSSLVKFSKGYYTEDLGLVKTFEEIFDCFWKPMEQINTRDEVESNYPNRLDVPFNGLTVQIDITAEWSADNPRHDI